MTRADIVEEARSWINVPYRIKGRTRKGLDCLGLLVMLAIRFEVPHVDHRDYTDWPDPQRRILLEFDRYMRIAPMSPLLPGTIGVFADQLLPGHTGVFSMRHDRLHVVHARIDVKKVIEQEYRTEDVHPEMRLIRAYTFPGTED